MPPGFKTRARGTCKVLTRAKINGVTWGGRRSKEDAFPLSASVKPWRAHLKSLGGEKKRTVVGAAGKSGMPEEQFVLSCRSKAVKAVPVPACQVDEIFMDLLEARGG